MPMSPRSRTTPAGKGETIVRDETRPDDERSRTDQERERLIARILAKAAMEMVVSDDGDE